MSEDQGPWKKKIKVSLWFKENTDLQYMIVAMKGIREEMVQRVQSQWILCQGQS